MKRNGIFTAFCVSLLLTVGTVFAEGEYTVQSVKGVVTYQEKDGSWCDVKKGMLLSADSVVKTGLRSELVVSAADKTAKIKAVKNGTLSKLSGITTGIKKGAVAAESEISAEITKGTTNISTAASRASEGVIDNKWQE